MEQSPQLPSNCESPKLCTAGDTYVCLGRSCMRAQRPDFRGAGTSHGDEGGWQLASTSPIIVPRGAYLRIIRGQVEQDPPDDLPGQPEAA